MDARLRSRWGPVRTATAGWAKRVTDAVVRHQAVKQDGAIDPSFARYVQESLIGGMFAAAEDQVREGVLPREALPQMQAEIFTLSRLVACWGHYVACGRQLFDFTPGLVEALRHTDVGGTRLAGLQTPYPAFYVRFGRQVDLSLPYGRDDAEYVDGAYFSFTLDERSRPLLSIFMSMVLEDGTGLEMSNPHVNIRGELFELPIEEALDAAAKDAAVNAADLQTKLMTNPRGMYATMGYALHQKNQESEALVRRALPLLVNTLYYLSDPPKAEARPGEDTPRGIREKLERSATSRAREKAMSSLFGHGYAMVRLCGTEFPTHGTGSREREVRTHWRRGHYRDQRYGAGWQQVRRIWIRPVKVNADKALEEGPGHRYVADQMPQPLGERHAHDSIEKRPIPRRG